MFLKGMGRMDRNSENLSLKRDTLNFLLELSVLVLSLGYHFSTATSGIPQLRTKAGWAQGSNQKVTEAIASH